MGMGNTNGTFQVIDIKSYSNDKSAVKNMKTTIDPYENLNFNQWKGKR